MQKIAEHLYLGGLHDAQDLDGLSRWQITHIV